MSKGQSFSVLTENNISWNFIYTVTELKAVSGNLSSNYILMTDLYLSSEASWDPIGDSSTPFTGRFNGNGHTISNMRITTNPDTCSGLFATTDSSAEIKNLNLTGVYINSTKSSTGCLVGEVKGGVITNCHVWGKVISNSATTDGLIAYINCFYYPVTISYSSFHGTVNGANRSGGLIGYVINADAGEAIQINDCYAEAAVIASDFGTVSEAGGFAGGIVKNNSGIITVTDCYALCTVAAPGCSLVGGFAGQVYSAVSNSLTVENCYAAANGSVFVTGATGVGGFTGRTNADGSATIEITDCYCTGTVNGNTNVGGFVGQYNSGAITTSYTACEVGGTDNIGGFSGTGGTCTDCYFMDNIPAALVNGYGTYLDGTARYNLSSYSKFNPDAPDTIIWLIDNAKKINSGYPYLVGLVP